MEKTQNIADEYNEKKLKKEDIDKAKSIDDLLVAIDSSEGLQGSQEYFDKDKLKMIIEMVRDGELGFEYITRSGGLRQKVFDILNKPKKVAKPKAGQPIEQPIEVEKEFIVDDAEQITPLPEDKTSGKVLEFENKKKRAGIKKEGISPMLIEDAEDASLEKDILKKREYVEEARNKYARSIKEIDKYSQIISGNIFKKFLFKSFGIGGKRLDNLNKVSQTLEYDYHKSLDDLLSVLTEKKFKEIINLGSRANERREFNLITKDLMNEIIKDNEYFSDPELESKLEEFVVDGVIDISILKRKKIFSEDQYNQVLEFNILSHIRNEIMSEENKILDSLLDRVNN